LGSLIHDIPKFLKRINIEQIILSIFSIVTMEYDSLLNIAHLSDLNH
jgi:hypothetical protein